MGAGSASHILLLAPVISFPQLGWDEGGDKKRLYVRQGQGVLPKGEVRRVEAVRKVKAVSAGKGVLGIFRGRHLGLPSLTFSFSSS